MDRKIAENRKVIIVYKDCNERLANLLMAHLRGTVRGVIFSCRNSRYGCNPDCYRNVVKIDDAELDVSASNVWKVLTLSYQDVKKENRYSNYTMKKHIEMQARKFADEIASRF